MTIPISCFMIEKRKQARYEEKEIREGGAHSAFSPLSVWVVHRWRARPSGPAGAVLQRPRLGGSPPRVTEEMWRSENPWCSTEEKETGDAAGMILAFGDWTCANPEGQLSTCLWKLQRTLLPNSKIFSTSKRHRRSSNKPALIEKLIPCVFRQLRLMLMLFYWILIWITIINLKCFIFIYI